MEQWNMYEAMCVYAVTDRSWLHGETLASQVEKALKGGATFVQLRDKGVDDETFVKDALEIQKLCKKYQVPFVINDRVDLARQIDADGVHVGQKDMEAAKAREILGPEKIIGVSARTVEQAKKAKEEGASYLGVGAVFPTGTKSDAKKLDHQVLRDITEQVGLPVVAIGGITRENVLELSGTGVSGIAVVSAIFAQDDIEHATRELCKLSHEMMGK